VPSARARHLADDQQQLLRTLPRRGYLFTAQVARGTEQLAPGASAEIAEPVQSVAHPPPLSDKPSIAVLPF
jgi:DNA-binding winged helix-turn-helix (wHTH) protein